ncbi:hypothetical protein Vafri_12685 [Volvox africanus]|uniref:Uncharacterized protein n=1 Tax=Volvox africanus TaxID=51714 RepID=A0A8J4BB06_9CHLO|nr:hypothetical protein Vafri_12685 [Volvox africanus]
MASIATDGPAMAWSNPELWSNQEEPLFSSPTCSSRISAGPSLTSSPSDACTSSNISYSSSSSIQSVASKVANTHVEQDCPSLACGVCFVSPASSGTTCILNDVRQDHEGSVESVPNLPQSSILQQNARFMHPLTQSKDGRVVVAWRYTGKHGKPFSTPCGAPLAANRVGTGATALQRSSNIANSSGWRRGCSTSSGRSAAKAVAGASSAARTVTWGRNTADSMAALTSASSKAGSVVPKDMHAGSTVRKPSASRGDIVRQAGSITDNRCCMVRDFLAAGNMAGAVEPGGNNITDFKVDKPLSVISPSATGSVGAPAEQYAIADTSRDDYTFNAQVAAAVVAAAAESTFTIEPFEKGAPVAAEPVAAGSSNLTVDSTSAIILAGTTSAPAALTSALEVSSPTAAVSCGFRARSAHGRVALVVEVYENLSRIATARSVPVQRRS